MLFYFVIHTLLGMMAANVGNIRVRAEANVGAFPLWVHGPWALVSGYVGIASAVASIFTTFGQWGFSWTLVTIAELVFGAVVVGFLPMGLRLILAAVSPLICVVIMGALWGFWYI